VADPAHEPAHDEPALGKLTLRVISSLILIAVIAAVVWFGPPAFDLFILVCGMVLAYEWQRLFGEGTWSVPTLGLFLAVAASVVVASLARPLYGLAVCGVGTIAVYAAEAFKRRAMAAWFAIGTLYIGVPAIALIGIAHDPQWGRQTLAVAIVAVAATDIGAYFTGKAFGGPKLAPRISPKKTWAGLIGGIVCASLLTIGMSRIFGFPAWLGAALGAGLAVISQMGDLFESAIKRRFGVKDSGGIIPGHGGLFDRVDGHLAAACAVAAAHWATGGSILTWR
jgi:phosphatidate cytidylyltransferase